MKRADLNMDKIARELGAKRHGTVRARGGYFGALELASDVEKRFRSPKGGGRATDPSWTERRLVGLSARTLKKLKQLTTKLSQKQHISLEPMQLAALMLERALDQVDEKELERLLPG